MPLCAADLLSDPLHLLHRIHLEQDRLVFLPTSRDLVEQAGFLDGRTRIETGTPVACRIGSALAALDGRTAETGRFIFHMSFCGSTLLARLVDCPGRTFVLREPSALVDLADIKVRLGRRAGGDPRLAALLRLVRFTLARSPGPDEQAVVKPSNWANNLVADLCADPTVRPLFVTIGRRDFVRAVFRGGRDRLVFTARAAAHLAAASIADQALLAAAAKAAPSPLGQVAHMAVLLHWLQLRGFARAAEAAGLGAGHFLGYDSIVRAPVAAADAAAEALGLDLRRTDLIRAADRHLGRDAKQPGALYSAAAHDEADAAVERHHGREIEAALEWAADLLPAAALPQVETEPVRRAG